MQNARLPIELCELIIDYCYIETVESHHAEDWVVYPRYAALLACSLTCSDWLPRAHRNLYRHIWLRSSRTADLLERTLTSMPRLGPLVLELTVGARSTSNYISFARATFVRLLENIRYLHLHWMSQYHPPQYHRRLHPFPITELFIHFRSLETGYILGDLWLIWSLPELRSCDILFPYGPGRSEHFSRAVHMAETLIAQREESGVCICKNLHQLRLLTYMSYVWAGFLPKGAFGRSIRHLHVALGPLGVNVVPG
ncbi:hypothetical protein L227DRAFT_391923 [Lentinus tigrinus ALCF2SS1-6]|uniref:F-box domain-containing protein n=1 Tax=Lentinus tigrinus ALCF2SS1-6 TaxID=1328759 RepID=A0A5C2SJS7_9APHY|nr:hypothetical protein L227DRAFT_391923 [Lentinus tigrinus ALCF2SS1-6]